MEQYLHTSTGTEHQIVRCLLKHAKERVYNNYKFVHLQHQMWTI